MSSCLMLSISLFLLILLVFTSTSAWRNTRVVMQGNAVFRLCWRKTWPVRGCLHQSRLELPAVRTARTAWAVPGESNAYLHANETHMFAWNTLILVYIKNKRFKMRFTNTRYDVPKRSALAHGMQCHPFRIRHIVKYLDNFRSNIHEKNAMSCSVYNLAAHFDTSLP